MQTVHPILEETAELSSRAPAIEFDPELWRRRTWNQGREDDTPVDHKLRALVWRLVLGGYAVIALLLWSGDARAQDSWTGKDKLQHAAGSAAIAAAVTVATSSERAGFWTSVAVGAAKEVYDTQHRDRHTPSLKDFGADVAGAYLGSKLGAYIVVRRNSISVTKQF